MLARYTGRLCSLKTIVERGAHRCTSISDTASREAIGKPARVQVRRALLRDFFRQRGTMWMPGRSDAVFSEQLSLPDVRGASNDVA